MKITVLSAIDAPSAIDAQQIVLQGVKHIVGLMVVIAKLETVVMR